MTPTPLAPSFRHGVYWCRRGCHGWFDTADAAKCCDPAWKRVLVFGGGECQQECAGVMIGREWRLVSELEVES